MSAAPAGLRAQLTERARQAPTRTLWVLGGAAAAAGAVALAMGLAGAERERTWWAYHVNFVFWTPLAQGLVVFAAVQKLAKGRWAGGLIRFAQAAGAFLLVALALFLGLYAGRDHIFTWLDEPRGDLGWWLTSPAFFARTGAVLLLTTWLSWRFLRRDLEPDVRELAEGRPVEVHEAAEQAIARDAAFVVLAYAFGYTLLAFDLVMSLAHKWVSNLFGAFFFMGGFLGGLAMLALLGHWFRRAMGLQAVITPKQLHDLGKLLFGFTVFWAYLMWSQFLVIWYGNLPEETYFVFYRLWGPWRPVATAVFLLVFALPFVGLLGVRPKRYPPTLIGFAVVSLAGLWLERYLEVVPSVNHGAGPALGVPEAGVTVFFAGLFLLSYAWFAGRYPMVSPRLAAAVIEEHH